MVKNIPIVKPILWLLFMGALFGEIPASAGGDSRARGRAQTADRRFLKEKFDKAMSLYEQAAEEAVSDELRSELRAKAGRLYFMLRRYDDAPRSFGQAMSLREGSLTTNDVCDYIDALRYLGRTKQAEEVCLYYAYGSVFSRSQRYFNTLEALSMGEMPLDGDFTVMPVDGAATEGSEYWIGDAKGAPFYAVSHSAFNDPRKRFYYDTEYYKVIASGRRGNYAPAPKGMEQGPLSMARTTDRIIGTVVEGRSARKIEMIDGRLNPYTTKLVISIRKRSGRWSDFKPLFAQESAASYCHPFLADDDRLLLFASDVVGGYGGYDLYMMHWDDELNAWGTPVNMGPEINTEGDELFPSYSEGQIFFASNGLPGQGGLDLYAVAYDVEREILIQGSQTRLPAPFNSSYNDFCLHPMDANWGYFISDRNLKTGDDLYTYRLLDEVAAGIRPDAAKPFFGMSEQEAILGGQMLVSQMLEKTSDHRSMRQKYPAYAPKKQVLTLYFDFDSAELTAAAAREIERFKAGNRDYEITSFRILGYADEMGTETYNQDLSEERGRVVAVALQQRFRVPMNVKGCGRTPLTPQQRAHQADNTGMYVLQDSPAQQVLQSLNYAERIRSNSPARRVEVYVNE